MKLLCSCGHPNHVHFAGTQRCHYIGQPVWIPKEPTSTAAELSPFPVRCPCERFVPELKQRADLA